MPAHVNISIIPPFSALICLLDDAFVFLGHVGLQAAAPPAGSEQLLPVFFFFYSK